MISEADIRNARILIVDDHDTDVVLLESILAAFGYTSVSSTMDSRPVAQLYQTYRHDLILLDLNMPLKSGFQLLAELRAIESEDYLPVLAVTAQPDHKLRALEAGAKDFISKPFDQTEVLTRIHNMLEVRLLYKQVRDHNHLLEGTVRERTAELRASYRETILTMTSAAEHKDEDTGRHIQRIGSYCQELATRLGMDGVFCEQILYASPMHDIGKIAIPDHILLKPGELTPDEWVVMKTHTVQGAHILSGRESPYLRMGAEIALRHHECWDGSGYPDGLQGDAIPLCARIMTICDVYDALRSRRPYKPTLPHQHAIEIMAKGDGRTRPCHFDPAILHGFLTFQESFRAIYEANAD